MPVHVMVKAVEAGLTQHESVPYERATQELLDLAIGVLEDTKAEDLVVLDVRTQPGNLFDALVICTGNSARHGAAMADKLRVALKRAKHELLGFEGPGEMGWTLIDAGSVVVHIMLAEAREHYDLEGLWDMEGPQ